MKHVNLILCILVFFLSINAFAEEAPTNQVVQPRFVYVNEKSPVVAGTLGAVAGFGVGNFYAQNNLNGLIFLSSELIGWGLFLGGWFNGDTDNDGFFERSELSDMSALTIVLFFGGMGTIATSRVLGCITATQDAKNYNRRLEEKFRYTTYLVPFFNHNEKETIFGLSFKL
jgi:hypothetical protein